MCTTLLKSNNLHWLKISFSFLFGWLVGCFFVVVVALFFFSRLGVIFNSATDGIPLIIRNFIFSDQIKL